VQRPGVFVRDAGVVVSLLVARIQVIDTRLGATRGGMVRAVARVCRNATASPATHSAATGKAAIAVGASERRLRMRPAGRGLAPAGQDPQD
jgi:hypothetical protein